MNKYTFVKKVLPKLPKLRSHKEADVTPLVMEWFKKNWKKSYAVEVKIVGGRIKKHQPVALKKVLSNEFDMKLKDWGALNPFDFFGLKNADAFIVICSKRNCIAYTPDMKEAFRFNV